MAGIDQVNSFNQAVPFKGKEDGQSSGAGKYLGAGLLGAGGYFGARQWMTSPLSQDTFAKNLKDGTEIKYTSELDAKEKDLVAKATKEAKTEPKPEVKAETKTETKPETATKPEAEVKPEAKTKTATDKELERIFDKKADLKPNEYLEGKYGYEVSGTEDLANKIKEAKKKIVGQDKEAKANDPNLASKKKAADFNVSTAEKFKQRSLEQLKLENKIENAKLELESYKTDMALRGKTPDANIIATKEKAITELETKCEKITKQVVEDAKNFNPNATLISEHKAKSEAVLKDTLEKANVEGGSITRAGKTAETRALAVLKEQAKAEAKAEALAAGKTQVEIKQAIEDAVKAVDPKNAVVKSKLFKAVEAAKAKEEARITAEVSEKRLGLQFDKVIKSSKHTREQADKKLKAEGVSIKEMEADLQLARDAKKNGKSITKAEAGGILEVKATAKAEIEKVAANAKSAIGEAFEALKGKFPKMKASHLKAGLIGGGIALAVLVVGSMMGGKKETPEA